MSNEDNLPARTVTSAELDTITEADVELFLAILAGEVEVLETDPGTVSREMLTRTLMAPDADAVLAELGSTTALKDIVGKVIQVTDWRLRAGNIDDSPVYMLIDCADAQTGEIVTYNTSARTIMAQLARLKWLGELPILVKIKQSDKATASGYYPLSLVRPLD